jgi:hypothetical protein
VFVVDQHFLELEQFVAEVIVDQFDQLLEIFVVKFVNMKKAMPEIEIKNIIKSDSTVYITVAFVRSFSSYIDQ